MLQTLGVIMNHNPHDNALERRGQRSLLVVVVVVETQPLCICLLGRVSDGLLGVTNALLPGGFIPRQFFPDLRASPCLVKWAYFFVFCSWFKIRDIICSTSFRSSVRARSARGRSRSWNRGSFFDW